METSRLDAARTVMAFTMAVECECELPHASQNAMVSRDVKVHAPFGALELAKKLGVKWAVTTLAMKRARAKVKSATTTRKKRFIF